MRLDPADGALANVRRVLASTDAAPARCEVAGKGVRLMRAMTCDDALAAGEVLVSHGRVALGCADGALEVLVVKPDGKREMQASAWAAGLRAGHLALGADLDGRRQPRAHDRPAHPGRTAPSQRTRARPHARRPRDGHARPQGPLACHEARAWRQRGLRRARPHD